MKSASAATATGRADSDCRGSGLAEEERPSSSDALRMWMEHSEASLDNIEEGLEDQPAKTLVGLAAGELFAYSVKLCFTML